MKLEDQLLQAVDRYYDRNIEPHDNDEDGVPRLTETVGSFAVETYYDHYADDDEPEASVVVALGSAAVCIVEYRDEHPLITYCDKEYAERFINEVEAA